MPRAGLSHDAVVALALAVIDEGGDLTLAAVAAKAGVAVPSLYKHVRGLPDLRRSVAIVCLDGFTAHLRDAGRDAGGDQGDGEPGAMADGRTRPHALAAATRAYALAHPGRYTAVQGSSWTHDPDADAVRAAAARSVAVFAEALTDLGLAPDRTIDAVRAFRATVHGFVMLELDGGFGMPDDVGVSFDYAVDGLLTGLLRLSAPGSPGGRGASAHPPGHRPRRP